MTDQHRKTIACVIPSLHVGGMERVMSILVQEFAARPNLDVHLILYGRKPTCFYAIPENVQLHQPQFDFDKYPRIFSSLGRMLFLRQTLRRIHPDAVLSFGEYWNSFVLLSTLGQELNLYVSDRCQPSKSLGKVQDVLRKWLYPRARKVIAQTGQAVDILKKQIPRARFVVIENPINLPQDLIHGERELIVLSVGRLINTKHHDRLIKIFHQRRCRLWKLMIAGDDALKQQHRARLEELIQFLGEKDYIKLLGNCQSLDSWYRRASIFAFCSSSEGFPNVVAEALSYGLPVVSYDCETGPAEMISDGVNGYLIDLFDDQTFATKLNFLMVNGELRKSMGANARDSILNLSSNRIAAKYLFEMLGDF